MYIDYMLAENFINKMKNQKNSAFFFIEQFINFQEQKKIINNIYPIEILKLCKESLAATRQHFGTLIF